MEKPRTIIPAEDHRWQDARVHDLTRGDDGTFTGTMEMGTFSYFVRSYRKEDGAVCFQFQAQRDAESEQAFLDYLERKVANVRAG